MYFSFFGSLFAIIVRFRFVCRLSGKKINISPITFHTTSKSFFVHVKCFFVHVLLSSCVHAPLKTYDTCTCRLQSKSCSYRFQDPLLFISSFFPYSLEVSKIMRHHECLGNKTEFLKKKARGKVKYICINNSNVQLPSVPNYIQLKI